MRNADAGIKDDVDHEVVEYPVNDEREAILDLCPSSTSFFYIQQYGKA